MGFNKPSSTEQRSVARYLENHKPVKEDERAYVEFKEDLVTLRPGREHAWLDRMIEASLRGAQKPFPFIHVRSPERSRFTLFLSDQNIAQGLFCSKVSIANVD